MVTNSWSPQIASSTTLKSRGISPLAYRITEHCILLNIGLCNHPRLDTWLCRRADSHNRAGKTRYWRVQVALPYWKQPGWPEDVAAPFREFLGQLCQDLPETGAWEIPMTLLDELTDPSHAQTATRLISAAAKLHELGAILRQKALSESFLRLLKKHLAPNGYSPEPSTLSSML